MSTVTMSAKAAEVAALLAVGLCAATVAPAWAADDPPTYVIGVENLEYLPAFAVAEGQYIGYARELLDAFAADANLRFDYRPMPVRRLYASLAAGAIDFKFPANPNWNPAFRAEHGVIYSFPVADFLDASVVTVENVDITPDEVKSLGTVTGFGTGPWNDRIAAGSVALSENGDSVSLARQVLAGRVDAAYASIAVINHVLDHELGQPGTLVFAPNLPHDYGSYRMSTITYPEVIDRFDAWMEDNAPRVAALKAEHGVERGVHTSE